jgi:hypothetical protein
VEERGERGWEGSWQDLDHAWLGFPLLLLSLNFSLKHAWAGVVLGVVMVNLLGIVVVGRVCFGKKRKRRDILT